MADETKNPEVSSVQKSNGTTGFEATQLDDNMSHAQQLPPEDTGAELSPGQVLGKCRIVKELGRGGMGAVYMAEHTTLDVKVAVKILPPSIASKHPQFAERFMREAKLAARIQHGNIIQVMDAEQDKQTGLYYIVMEFVDGGSVRDLMKEGPLAEDKASDIVLKVAEALDAASDLKIVHRDIKPDNIMLTRKGQVKLADLGIAKERTDDDSGITMSCAMMGTPAYISPEQAMDAKNADSRADIYSLGATLYHMLVGAPPYEGETTYSVLTKLATDPTPDPRASRPDLSNETAELCMKMMAKNKEERPQSPKELIELVSALRSKLATGATTFAEEGGIKLRTPSTRPQGTPTQGVSGTDHGIPATKSSSVDAPTVGSAPTTQLQTAPATTSGSDQPAIQMSASGMKMLIAAAAFVIVAIVAGIVLSKTDKNPGQSSTRTTATQSPTTVESNTAVATANGAETGKDENYSATTSKTPTEAANTQNIVQIPNTTSAKTPVNAIPADAKIEIPEDPALIQQAIAEVKKISDQQAEKGYAVMKKNGSNWLKNPEIRMVGMGMNDKSAEDAAFKQALGAAVMEIAMEPESNETHKALAEMMKAPQKYIRKTCEFKKDTMNGKHYVAMGVTPRAGKLGKFLYANNVAVKDIYALVGKPSVGVDIREKVLDLSGKEMTGDARRAQRMLEKELTKLGVSIVDVTGMGKTEQRQSCDILITGSSEAKMRWNRPLPANGGSAGGTMPFYVYKCEFSMDVILSSTGSKIPLDIFKFNPTGADAFRKYGNHDKDEAATKAIEATVSQSLEPIGKKLLDEWVKHSSEADYWVGVTKIKGASQINAVEAALKSIKGISQVTRRYYRNGTAEFSIQFEGSGRNLGDLIEKESKLLLVLTGQQGLRLEFEYEKN